MKKEKHSKSPYSPARGDKRGHFFLIMKIDISTTKSTFPSIANITTPCALVVYVTSKDNEPLRVNIEFMSELPKAKKSEYTEKFLLKSARQYCDIVLNRENIDIPRPEEAPFILDEDGILWPRTAHKINTGE